MRIKLDENLPQTAAAPLRALGHDVDTVLDERLGGAADGVVGRAAQGERRFLVTQDLDFSDILIYAPGTHHGLLVLRGVFPQPGAIVDLVVACFALPEAQTWGGCLVVASPARIRVSRPPT